MRKSGILLPISSLPSKYGIGTFSKEAYQFVDFLEKAGQKIWQILPLGPTGYGDSPYQSFSTFAGNPYYIDLEELIMDGLLTEQECIEASNQNDDYVDYEQLFHNRLKLLDKAYANSDIQHQPDYQLFIKENEFWLKDYALFTAIKEELNGLSWNLWDKELKFREKKALLLYEKKLEKQIKCCYFEQYYFAKQWKKLKHYANSKKIKIVGDIPIYVAMDSADAWSHPELFQLDKELQPIAVAGCPPDVFAKTGQLWGNPLYRWEYHKKTKYEWWMKRFEHSFGLYDCLRIDHFRGFDAYYAIPYKDETAEFGHWEDGPGYELFKTMKETLGKKDVIAEDLGFLTDAVRKMVKKTGFPGMKVLQFAFDCGGDSDYLPHNYPHNCVVYTGTHDNDTTKHWYQTMSRRDRAFANRYMDIRTSSQACSKMVRLALASVADTAIIPIQDYLELGEEARINTPSTLGGNWKWRVKQEQLTDELAVSISLLCKLYSR